MATMLEQLIQFLQNHWLLSLTLLVTLALLIFEELRSKIGGMVTITPQEGILLINRGKGTVIDLRDAIAFHGAHIKNSLNFPSEEFDTKIKNLNLAKENTLILLGNQSTAVIAAGKKLKNLGYLKINILGGGLAAWEETRLPLVKNN